MKLAVAIADEHAMPNAFVVWRGIEASIQKAANLGYDGIELALKSSQEVDAEQLSRWLSKADMEVSCISTGQVYAALGLMFTDPNPEKRQQVEKVFREIIDLAERFGVRIQHIRGPEYH